MPVENDPATHWKGGSLDFTAHLDGCFGKERLLAHARMKHDSSNEQPLVWSLSSLCRVGTDLMTHCPVTHAINAAKQVVTGHTTVRFLPRRNKPVKIFPTSWSRTNQREALKKKNFFRIAVFMVTTWCSMMHRCKSVMAEYCLNHHCPLFNQNLDSLLLNYMIAGLQSSGLLHSLCC